MELPYCILSIAINKQYNNNYKENVGNFMAFDLSVQVTTMKQLTRLRFSSSLHYLFQTILNSNIKIQYKKNYTT